MYNIPIMRFNIPMYSRCLNLVPVAISDIPLNISTKPAKYVIKLAKLDIATGLMIIVNAAIIESIASIIESILTPLLNAKVWELEINKNNAIIMNPNPVKTPAVMVDTKGNATAKIPNMISINAAGLNLILVLGSIFYFSLL